MEKHLINEVESTARELLQVIDSFEQGRFNEVPFKDTWTGLAGAVRTQDLNATCLDFEMPTIGTLTRMEWISFAVVHTQRHIWQLKKMAVTTGAAN